MAPRQAKSRAPRPAERDAATPARRLTPKGEATRARLIRIAAEVFAEEGYTSASMRDIARRSGLSSGAIYGSFKGKTELLAEAVDATIASDVETLPSAVTELTLPEIDAYQYEHVPQRDRARALLLEAAVAARADADVRERLREILLPHIDMATDAHEEWRERAGVDRALDMRALVTLIWSADLGLGVLAALGVETPDPAAWSELIRRLLHSLEAPGAQPGAPTPRPTRRRAT
ncbi:MAG TPA: helix-turn-helix domain-containing protein [Acidimicrobiia bacterium]|nr:helix-turn-helix domain-containing protein [Acidimicrobiia bacterium]